MSKASEFAYMKIFHVDVNLSSLLILRESQKVDHNFYSKMPFRARLPSPVCIKDFSVEIVKNIRLRTFEKSDKVLH